MKTALIVANGTPPSYSLLIELLQEASLLIAADGGANYLYELELLPDFIVGDLDSIAESCKQKISPERLVEITEQQTNDLAKTIRYCLQIGVQRVLLTGVMGGQNDQFLANLEVVYRYFQQLEIQIWSDTEYMELITKTWQKELRLGTIISTLPLFGTAYGVSNQGLRYSLMQHDLIPGREPSGISNEVIDTAVQISVQSGCLLLIIHHFSKIEFSDS